MYYSSAPLRLDDFSAVRKRLRWSFWSVTRRRRKDLFSPLPLYVRTRNLALGGWAYRFGSAFRATAAAAARAWLVVEGAVEAFGNGYVGTGVDTAFHF